MSVGEQEERTGPRRAGREWFAALCALVALVASAIGLVFDFAPRLRPDPLANIGADVTVVAVEPGVSVEAWVRRTHPADAAERLRRLFGHAPSASERRLRGQVVYVRTLVDGHKHRDVTLDSRVFDARTQRETPILEPPGRLGDPIRLEAPSQRSIQVLWLPSLVDEPPYFVRVELRDGDGLLAVADSEVLVNGRVRGGR